MVTDVPVPFCIPRLTAKNFLSSLESALTSIELDCLIVAPSAFALIALSSMVITEPIPTPKPFCVFENSTPPVNA